MIDWLIFIAKCVHAGMVLAFIIHALLEHGDSEHNVVRTAFKAMRGLIWPIVLLRYFFIHRAAICKRIAKDWREVFPRKQITDPSPVEVSTLGTSEPKHLPGGWIDHVG